MKELVTIVIFLLATGSAMAQTLSVGTGSATMDGVMAPGEWPTASLSTGDGVTLKAMADGGFLYVVAQWADATESIAKNTWTFNGTNWVKSGDEDRIAFVWDMGLNGAEGASCTTMCHVDKMRTTYGLVDNWHWKAARGAIMGYADDQYWDTADRKNDTGTSAYSDNVLSAGGTPTSMATGDPGRNAHFLAKDVAALSLFAVSSHTSEIAVPYSPGAGFATGATIPGYILRTPAGDRASIRTASRWANGVWTVEFKRPYAGTQHDFGVIPGGSVQFSHATFDNVGATHFISGFDPTVYTLDFAGIPSAPANTITVMPGTPLLDGVLTPGEWTARPVTTHAGVTLNAMADKNYLYVAAQWVDPTESIAKNTWTFNGTAWTKSGDEDRISFVWDMGLNGTEGANCGTMCHGTKMYTATGFVDNWHWKAARGAILGYSDDQYWDTSDRKNDAGTSSFSDNVLTAGGTPTFMAASDPGANAHFLANNASTLALFAASSHVSAEAVAFNTGASFANGATIPGYVLRTPAGDRASVQTSSKWANGMWTVEFRRALVGSPNDFEARPGGSVSFTHEIFDNVGGTHFIDGWDDTLYALDLALVTGVETERSEVPAGFTLEQNYPNPFNPSTRIMVTLDRVADLDLAVYDLLGRRIRTLSTGSITPGSHQFDFDADGLSSGIYLYVASVDGAVTTRKMTLLR